MKKNLFVMFAVLLTVASLSAACTQNAKQTAFEATVLENQEGSLLVSPKAGTAEASSSDRISVSLKNAKITDLDGKEITADGLAEGDVVEITYGGTIAESYPAQISDCTRVSRKEKAPDPDPDDPGGGQLPNPMVEFSNPDFTEQAGFSISQMPNGDDLVIQHIWLIDGRIAQMDYLIEDHFEATLRIAVDTGEEISGVYGETYEETSTQEDEGRVVTLRNSPGGPALATWTYQGYAFSLYFPHTQMGMAGGLTHTFVVGTALIPAEAPAADGSSTV